MSGVHRFLSKRDKHRDVAPKHHHIHQQHQTSAVDTTTVTLDPSSAIDFYGLFNDGGKISGKDEDKAKTIRARILSTKGVNLKDGQISWALKSDISKGDAEYGYDLLLAMSDAIEGIVTPYNPNVKLRGAINRQNVTCYLDATLFSMFSRLDSFEAMLYNSFEDVPRNKLAFLLRLWVNLLRSGKLITTDITKCIQEAMAQCGWPDAKLLRQQDASEAFTFITERLELPLLTLKMDIYHTGKQDSDDHRFINERLLEVAIPSPPPGSSSETIKLEDCLEEYFNNRIEVKRYLERRTTINSTKSADMKNKGDSVHVEAVEVDPDSYPVTPLSPAPSYMAARPITRHRTHSIIQERYIADKGEVYSASPDEKTTVGRLRKGSVRKEVLMPAWQFFSLIPWYTDNTPSNDAQVAAHFSSKRPILGLCLKRYSYTTTGKSVRLNTHIDIPIEIGLPHFIQDDRMSDDGPLYGTFKLSLQSVVCHRGNSVDSGHYIALVRSTTRDACTDKDDFKQWMRFDDLAPQRITLVDIDQALREETPYLLFYQIMPVDGDPGNLTAGEAPPSRVGSDVHDSGVSSVGEPLGVISSRDSQAVSDSPGVEADGVQDTRGRSTTSDRRPSAIVFADQLQPPSSQDNVYERGATSLSPEHRKTGSQNDGISRTSAKLAPGSTRNSKDLTRTEIESAPRIQVDEVAGGTTLVPETVRNHSDVSAYQQHKSHGREKSRNRLMKGGIKNRNEHPDRECILM